MKYNEMSTTDVVEYINSQLRDGRTMKDIEEKDFGENKGVIQKRLNRKGYIKNNNQFISAKNNTKNKIQEQKDNNTNDNTKIIHDEEKETTRKTTKIIQRKPSNEEGKKVFSNEEIEKLNQLLKLDVNVLEKIIQEYTTKSSICIKDNSTIVTSIRVNKELYAKVKKKAKEQNVKLQDIFYNMMANYLSK